MGAQDDIKGRNGEGRTESKNTLTPSAKLKEGKGSGLNRGRGNKEGNGLEREEDAYSFDRE
jgi:hypothetical protein